MQRIAIVDPSDATREPLRNLLLGVESVWIEAECARYEFFLDVVQQSNPDVAIVSMDADQGKALSLIQQLRAVNARLPILAVGRPDVQTILQSQRSGARQFLPQPLVLDDVLRFLQELRPDDDGGKIRGQAKVIAVLGSRGGVGCTSLAVNLGCSLAADKNNSVAVLDLDLALGDADVALDLIPSYTLADVAQNVSRLDMAFLKRSLCQHEKTHLALLPHPVRIEELGLIHEEHLQRAIQLLRASYTHLVLDLSKSFTVMDYTAMRMADIILLLCQLELTSLRNTVRILLTMESEAGLTDKIKVVVNRVGSEEGDITLAKAEETIGKPIYWQVPNDFKAMMGSRNAGEPLIVNAPKSKAHQSITDLANALCGKAAAAEAPPPAKKKSGFSIFGR